MQIGRVIGCLVSTQKNAQLHGAKLLLVQPTTPDGAARGPAVLAIDSVGAGIGERVLIVLEGRAAGEALRRKAAPVDAAIVGIVDAIECEPAAIETAASGSSGAGLPDLTGDAGRRASRPRS